jgi:hypothetical protein
MRKVKLIFFLLCTWLALAGNAFAVAPENGWWWNPSESGTGYAIERQGNSIFMAAFLYETSGAATWYATVLALQPDGTYKGDMTRFVGGKSLLGSYKPPTTSTVVATASASFEFSDMGTLTIGFLNGAPSRIIEINRFAFASPVFDPSKGSFQNGWWWNDQESGTGYFVEVQGDQAFIASFMYDTAGQPTWYASVANLSGTNTLAGPVDMFANGQSIGGVYKAPTVNYGAAGTMSYGFTSDSVGSMTLPNNGRVSIKRFIFDANVVGNHAPVPNAGTAQTVQVGDTVYLNGSGTDSDNDPITYSWSFLYAPTGSTTSLYGWRSQRPYFVADLPGTYRFGLLVDDGKVGNAGSVVTVTATPKTAPANIAPVANAGANQGVTSGARVTLSGSASSDANGDALTHSWFFATKPANSSAILAGATTVSPSFTADVAGTYVIGLTVYDGKVSSSQSSVTVTVTPANIAPVANAGSNQSVTAGTSVTLNGSFSSDANGDVLTYSWSFTSKPSGSSATLSGATSVSPTFKADLAGTYVIRLTVNDGKVSSSQSSVTVTASSGDTYSLVLPTMLSSTPIIGTPAYPAPVNDYGVGTISFAQSFIQASYGYASSTYTASISNPTQVYPVAHLTSDVKSAWASGWTGLGVSISVIDDFNTIKGNITRTLPVMARNITYEVIDNSYYGKVQGNYNVVYNWTNSWRHGYLVANIAGGDYDGQQVTATDIRPSIKSASLSSCTVLRPGTSYTIGCNTFSSNETFILSYKVVAGVAKQANVINNNVNLSSSQNPIKTIADIQGHLLNSANLGVINLSLGSEISTSGKTFNDVITQVQTTPVAFMNAVLVVAAGNGGAPCAAQDLNGCNAVAVAMAFQKSTAASTIVVGALSGSGSSQNIATYSTRAGILAERFVLSSGDNGDPGISGTSFAAPRVAGIAAILRQKFPTLTSEQIANIILLSASKDINNTGVDLFSGVSPIYGHGVASLSRALALAGAL